MHVPGTANKVIDYPYYSVKQSLEIQVLMMEVEAMGRDDIVWMLKRELDSLRVWHKAQVCDARMRCSGSVANIVDKVDARNDDQFIAKNARGD